MPTRSGRQRARPTLRGEARQRPARGSRSGRGLAGRLARAALRWGAVAAIWGAVLVAGLVAFYAYRLPDITGLEHQTRRPSLKLIDAGGALFASYGELHGETVPAAELPRPLIHAVVATEDRRFFDHFGFDLIGVARAAWVNLRAGAVRQGGSTLTQQLAKNLFLTADRSLERKVQELILAIWLERRFSKEQLLTIYLNRVYLGAGAYGIDAASQKYFGKSARELGLAESALLAGLLKAPSRYNPAANPEPARRRMAEVLENMVEAGYLDAGIAEAAGRKLPPIRGAASVSAGHRWFADWVVDQVAGIVGPGNADLVVRTTLEPELQRQAEAAVSRGLAKARGRDATQAALVALAPDGAVRAMVGGADYYGSQFNRATQALRQPGSAFKPIVYLAALESGMGPDTLVSNRPLELAGWRPGNLDGRFSGDVTLADALVRSLNVPTVRIAEATGRRAILALARRLGIASDLTDEPSLALGAGEVTPLELTGAYAAFANGGTPVLPYGVMEIRTPAGEILWRHPGSAFGTAIDPAAVGSLGRMLTLVIERGTGRAARIGRPVAGKTGTSQDFRDAWFVGYSADLVAGVWMGNDDGRPMREVAGGGLPAQLWADFMRTAHASRPAKPLLLPEVPRSWLPVATPGAPSVRRAGSGQQAPSPHQHSEEDIRGGR